MTDIGFGMSDTQDKEYTTKKEVDALNETLKQYGLLPIELVDPTILKGQQKNARYMLPEKFKTLVKNVKSEGSLESVPLVVKNGDRYEIISGHHRIDAAKEAGLEKVLVMVHREDLTRDEVVSKQLAHNALAGLDDKTLLSELFQSIEDVSLKIATGLVDEAGAISYESLNFKVGTFKEFTVMFLPEDVGLYDEAMELIAQECFVTGQTEVRLASMESWDKFGKVLRRIKKCENIKSNGTALMRMVELAQEAMVNGLHEGVQDEVS